MKRAMFCFVAALAFFILAGCGQRDKAKSISCGANLRQIGMAVAQYECCDDVIKPGLDGFKQLIRSDMLTDTRMYVCPFSSKKPCASADAMTEENCSYYLFQSHKEEKVPRIMHLPGNHSKSRVKKFCVIYGDGGPFGMVDIPAKETLEAYFIAALGHEPTTKLEKDLLEEARTWDRTHTGAK